MCSFCSTFLLLFLLAGFLIFFVILMFFIFVYTVSIATPKLSKLEYLDLSYNQLNGSIVPYLIGLSSLKALSLHWNNIGRGLPFKGNVHVHVFKGYKK